MQELKEVESIFKQTVHNQQQQILQKSQNIASQFLSSRSVALKNASVSAQVINDLEKQIKALSDLQASGAVGDEHMKKQISEYVHQYSVVRNELIKNNRDYQKEKAIRERDQQQFMQSGKHFQGTSEEIKKQGKLFIEQQKSTHIIMQQNELVGQSQESVLLQKKQVDFQKHRNKRKVVLVVLSRGAQILNLTLLGALFICSLIVFANS